MTLVPEPRDWGDAIRAFEEQDALKPPGKDCVVFTGSSSIRRWDTLQDDFPFVETVNRGFGGSYLSELPQYAHRIVTPYQPSKIFVYAGGNDICAGTKAEDVLCSWEEFERRVREKSDAPIFFISYNPVPGRWDDVPELIRANEIARAYAGQTDEMTFIDVFTEILEGRDKPRTELFVEDGIHMSKEGYAIWTRVIEPHARR